MKPTILLSVLLLLGLCSHGQRNHDADQDYVMINRPFQISLIPFLGTNGFRSGRVSNVMSFNMIGGYNGGLKGMEFGGMFNILRSHAYGVQFAGVFNVVGGRTSGGQFAGLMNVGGDRIKGIQAAGALNIAGERTLGSQFAGLMNVSAGNLRGIQAAGAVNFAGSRSKEQEEDEWVFAANPHQLAGESGSKGAQFAGFLNVATGDFYGLQASGFMNVARRMHGYQIGIINIAESVDNGVPIGLLSIVKDGYFRVEGGATESLTGVASLKIGVPRFYNIFSAGARVENGPSTLAVGYGIGTKFRHGKRIAYNIDAVSYQLFRNGFSWDDLNQLNRLSLNVSLHLAKRLAVYGGVAANVLISNNRENTIAPWTFFNETYNNTTVQIYPGVQAGIRL
ncbi:MAG: hypothetical protein AAF587_10415 [Bacteroidota bacterium]